jgi:hypothetical protein
MPDGRIRLAYKPTNAMAADRLYHQFKGMLGRLGMHEDRLHHRFAYTKSDIPVAGVAHQSGTCRFGTDPRTSVLNADCRAHEVDNLYVVDTSFFPSIGAVNPGLTAMANALRVGDHLLERLGVSRAATADTDLGGRDCHNERGASTLDGRPSVTAVGYSADFTVRSICPSPSSSYMAMSNSPSLLLSIRILSERPSPSVSYATTSATPSLSVSKPNIGASVT